MLRGARRGHRGSRGGQGWGARLERQPNLRPSAEPAALGGAPTCAGDDHNRPVDAADNAMEALQGRLRLRARYWVELDEDDFTRPDWLGWCEAYVRAESSIPSALSFGRGLHGEGPNVLEDRPVGDGHVPGRQVRRLASEAKPPRVRGAARRRGYEAPQMHHELVLDWPSWNGRWRLTAAPRRVDFRGSR